MKNIALFTLGVFLSIPLLAEGGAVYYFVFLNPNPDREDLPREEVANLQRRHLENIQRLAREQIIVGAGPFHEGGGIFMMRETSLERVQEHLTTDPAIRADRFRLEVYQMEIQHGGICPVLESSEMTTYQFIRYTIPAQADTRQNARFITAIPPSDSLIFAGYFRSNESGIAVFRNKMPEWVSHIFQEHPFSGEPGFSFELKKLWIAQETFCSPE